MLIDAFMIGWEWDILELRLNELCDIVDKFVLVESREMHGSNCWKTETLRDHWSVVKPFEDKIDYTLLDRLEPAFDKSTTWLRENYQRNQLMNGINAVGRLTDIAMVSDVDEIPRASTLKACEGIKFPDLLTPLFACCQELFYYDTSNFTGQQWHGTVIGTVAAIQKVGGPQAARNMRDNLSLIPDCGWHFSYMGGLGRVKKKISNFAHAQEDSCQLVQHRSDEELSEDIRTGRDLYHRPENNKERRQPDDPRLPKYLLANRDKFKHFEATLF